MHFIIALAGVLAVLFAVRLIHRLILSPIRHIPGPKLAAASSLYEFYFDVIKGGQYTHELNRLHKIYGPIIRISPTEVHVNDPDAYKDIYVENAIRKSDRYDFATKGYGLPGLLGLTVDHRVHSTRRKALNPFFSKSQVLRLEPIIHENLHTLLSKLRSFKESGRVVCLNAAFSSLAMDVVSRYCFGKEYGMLLEPDFAPQCDAVNMRVSRLVHVFNHFPRLMRLTRAIPKDLIAWLDPDMRMFFDRENRLIEQIDTIKSRSDSPHKDNEAFRTIFHDLIFQSKLPPQDLTTERLQHEGLGIIAAGSVTTARTLYLIVFFILSSPNMEYRLKLELQTVRPPDGTLPSWPVLEQLPFLTALIYEGLRLSYGVVHRSARVFPFDDFQYQQFTLPPGTPISFSISELHENPTLFPDPHSFKPERWLLEDANAVAELKKYWWPFSKGSRNCIGLNLAWAELYSTIAAIFGPDSGLSLELFETNERDVMYQYDFGAAHPSLDSKGVRVLVR